MKEHRSRRTRAILPLVQLHNYLYSPMLWLNTPPCRTQRGGWERSEKDIREGRRNMNVIFRRTHRSRDIWPAQQDLRPAAGVFKVLLTRSLSELPPLLQRSSCSSRSSQPPARPAARWLRHTSSPQTRWMPFLWWLQGHRRRWAQTDCSWTHEVTFITSLQFVIQTWEKSVEPDFLLTFKVSWSTVLQLSEALSEFFFGHFLLFHSFSVQFFLVKPLNSDLRTI